jgi:hypothetical protein
MAELKNKLFWVAETQHTTEYWEVEKVIVGKRKFMLTLMNLDFILWVACNKTIRSVRDLREAGYNGTCYNPSTLDGG